MGDRGSFLSPQKDSQTSAQIFTPSCSTFCLLHDLEILFAMLDSKSIILSGASRGIGLAIARYLLKGGHRLFLVARSEEPLEKLKEEFEGQVEFLGADLKDFEVGGFFGVNGAVVVCWCS